jgi:hypothetical protein
LYAKYRRKKGGQLELHLSSGGVVIIDFCIRHKLLDKKQLPQMTFPCDCVAFFASFVLILNRTKLTIIDLVERTIAT